MYICNELIGNNIQQHLTMIVIREKFYQLTPRLQSQHICLLFLFTILIFSTDFQFLFFLNITRLPLFKNFLFMKTSITYKSERRIESIHMNISYIVIIDHM